MIAKSITRTITIVLVVFALLAVSAAGFYFGFSYVLSQNERFDRLDEQYGTGGSMNGEIDRDTPNAVELVIPRAADTRDIAELLKEKGVIKNVFVFTMLSKFNGFDGAYMAGTHFVLKTMNYDEIMYSLVQKPQAVRVTFPEGLTYREVKQLLRDAHVNFDETRLDNMVRNPQFFLDYEFIRDIDNREGRDWLLQGYLFPDTYEFDLNTNEETILRTFLNNTERKLDEDDGKYFERAEQMGLTMDEVMTLASIIQLETRDGQEMRSVAGVYWKRLNDENWTLSADPTINYLRKEHNLEPKMWLSQYELNMYSDSLYNTYQHRGLPPGPICSPGRDAILAALYPENNKYWFFSAAYDGSTAFAETFEQHEANIARYDRDKADAETAETED